MKLNNGFWVDANNNKWNSDLYSEEEALKWSTTLNNCSYCGNCFNCSGCMYCDNCRDLSSCRNCNSCWDCSDCSYCNICSGCNYCSCCENCRDCNSCWDCKYCRNCNECSSCKSFCKNPERIIGSAMGSRSDNPAVYWIEAGKEQCVVGCFRGTLDELEKAVEKTHKDNLKYLEQYRKFIKAVRAYQGVMK